MSTTLDKIIEEIRQLPPDEKRQLREVLDAEAGRTETVPPIQPRDREREQQWIIAHRDEYLGQWVVVEGDSLIAHGNDAREVYNAAREAGISIPFVVRIEPYAEPSMGGWQ